MSELAKIVEKINKSKKLNITTSLKKQDSEYWKKLGCEWMLESDLKIIWSDGWDVKVTSDSTERVLTLYYGLFK